MRPISFAEASAICSCNLGLRLANHAAHLVRVRQPIGEYMNVILLKDFWGHLAGTKGRLSTDKTRLYLKSSPVCVTRAEDLGVLFVVEGACIGHRQTCGCMTCIDARAKNAHRLEDFTEGRKIANPPGGIN